MASWDKLVELVTHFDALLSNVRTDVHVVRGEDDWTPPGPTESLDKKWAYVERVGHHVRDTLEKAQTLSEDGRRKAYDSARGVVKEAQGMLEQLRKIPGPIAAGSLTVDAAKASADAAKKAADSAQKTLDDLADDLKTGAKWGLTAEIAAMGVVWIGLIAFIAWTLTRERSASHA